MPKPTVCFHSSINSRHQNCCSPSSASISMPTDRAFTLLPRTAEQHQKALPQLVQLWRELQPGRITPKLKDDFLSLIFTLGKQAKPGLDFSVTWEHSQTNHRVVAVQNITHKSQALHAFRSCAAFSQLPAGSSH